MAGNKYPRRRRHSGLERLKSLLIVLLTLSALALTLRVLLFNELAGQGPRGWLDNLTSLFRQEPTVSTGDPGGSIQSSADSRLRAAWGRGTTPKLAVIPRTSRQPICRAISRAVRSSSPPSLSMTTGVRSVNVAPIAFPGSSRPPCCGSSRTARNPYKP